MGGAALADGIDPKSIQTNSSVQTVNGLVNSMVGGTMLLLPTMTLQAGMFTTLIILGISCFVSFTTCSILTIHMKESELDVQWSIKRILGYKWYVFFVSICTFYLFFLCQLYYVLIVQMLYSMICFFFYIFGVSKSFYVDPAIAEKTFTFNQFSEQYVILITFFAILAMIQFIKDLSILVKIANVGVLAIYSYIIFIFYVFIDNIVSGGISDGEQGVLLFGTNIGNLAGTASLAFTIHTSFGNMIKCNKNQKNNVRDLGYTYIIGFMVYGIISIIGGLGILNRYTDVVNPTMITEYFKQGSLGPFIVQALYFGHLVSILPVFVDIMKRRVFPLVLKGKEASQKLHTIINISFMVISVAVKCIPGISAGDITNFDGALCCFFFVYLVPIIMHMTCYHGKNKFLRKVQRKISRFTDHKPLSDDDDDEDDFDQECNYKQNKNSQDEDAHLTMKTIENSYVPDEQQQQIQDVKQKLLDQVKDENENDLPSLNNDQLQVIRKKSKSKRKYSQESCNSHHDIGETSFIARVIFYSILMILGLAILIYGMITIFSQIFSPSSNDDLPIQ
ncbi:hypothetical protein PPERSA_05174 [Pseudocohnilembus persalinus]|uniref:Amino acid transporter transmembrane domain-containing protein n=1 Tax=Pseudocohnilembus persalinus TaxID=266149 RepID=A0A0V0R9B2_PSEPJ|nr:hypothetical protein PPERSA_05174 [Pseudocohnilembus persalinus]|eukprot:KRX11065.1 hypothetical protein PPERSA_05174 [Pseudocohnilembus persalinus]